MKRLIACFVSLVLLFGVLWVPMEISAANGNGYFFLDFNKEESLNYHCGYSNKLIGHADLVPLYVIGGPQTATVTYTTYQGKSVIKVTAPAGRHTKLLLLDGEGEPLELSRGHHFEWNVTMAVESMGCKGQGYMYAGSGDVGRELTYSEVFYYNYLVDCYRPDETMGRGWPLVCDANSLFVNWGDTPYSMSSDFRTYSVETYCGPQEQRTDNQGGTVNMNNYAYLSLYTDFEAVFYIDMVEIVDMSGATNVIQYFDGNLHLGSMALKTGLKNAMINFIPERPGQRFVGWYYDKAFNNSINNDTIETRRYGRMYFDETTGNRIKLYAKYASSVPKSSVTTTFGTEKTCYNQYCNKTAFIYANKYYTRIGMGQSAIMTFDADHLNIDNNTAGSRTGTVWVLNEDGTVFQPKPNTAYTITMTYSNPVEGYHAQEEILNSYRIVSGLAYENASLIDYSTTRLEECVQWSTYYHWRYYYPASTTITSVSRSFVTPDFDGYLPCIGLLISVSGNDEGVANDFNLYSVTVTEKNVATTQNVALVNAGASTLTSSAAAAAGSQALRTYCTYNTNQYGQVQYDGALHDVVSRGVLLKRSTKQAALIMENADKNGVKKIESDRIDHYWNRCVNGDNTYEVKFSSYVSGITSAYLSKSITFRYYLKLDDGTVVYGDEVSYNANTVLQNTPGETLQTSGGRQLVWRQEFDACTGINDTANLRYSYQMSASDIKNNTTGACDSVSNGVLTLTAKPSSDANYIAETCGFDTRETMYYRYGYLEMRAKVPFQSGAWPSFWLQSLSSVATASYMSEVDIFEGAGSDGGTRRIDMAMHKWGSGDAHDSITVGRYQFSSTSVANDWHVYGFEWTPTEVKVYVDGTLRISRSITSSSDFGSISGMAGFHDYQYVLVHNWIFTPAGNFRLSQAKTKSTMTSNINYSIDYIRLYQNNTTETMVDTPR